MYSILIDKNSTQVVIIKKKYDLNLYTGKKIIKNKSYLFIKEFHKNVCPKKNYLTTFTNFQSTNRLNFY